MISGIPGYPISVVPHPLGNLNETDLKGRANQAAPEVADILLKGK